MNGLRNHQLGKRNRDFLGCRFLWSFIGNSGIFVLDYKLQPSAVTGIPFLRQLAIKELRDLRVRSSVGFDKNSLTVMAVMLQDEPANMTTAAGLTNALQIVNAMAALSE